VSWDLRPEPELPDVRAVLVAAAEQALAEEEEGRWWRSGFDDLSGGPAPQQTWRDAGIVEA
jgi:hypothetical protein